MLFTEQIKNTRGAGSHGRRHVFCCYCAGRCWSVEGAVVTLDWLNWTSTALIDWWFFFNLYPATVVPPYTVHCTLHPVYTDPLCHLTFAVLVLLYLVWPFYSFLLIYFTLKNHFIVIYSKASDIVLLYIFFFIYFYLSSLFTSLDLAVWVLVISISCFILLHPSYFF